MNTQSYTGRDRLLAKINGQLAFMDVALTAFKHADIGEKVLTLMHRGITAMRGTLRSADSPDLEAFVCDFEDLLGLICAGEIKFSSDMIQLVRRSTTALAQGVEALQQGDSVADAVQDARDAVFSLLLDHAVTVRR